MRNKQLKLSEMAKFKLRNCLNCQNCINTKKINILTLQKNVYAWIKDWIITFLFKTKVCFEFDYFTKFIQENKLSELEFQIKHHYFILTIFHINRTLHYCINLIKNVLETFYTDWINWISILTNNKKIQQFLILEINDYLGEHFKL